MRSILTRKVFRTLFRSGEFSIYWDGMTNISYSSEFFDEMQDSNLASARVVVPLVLSIAAPVRSVVDIGCGRGLWLKAFKEAGVENVVGYDGDYVEHKDLMISAQQFHSQNLEEPVSFSQSFDLAVCLEVAEHLPASAADTLVENLTRAAPVVLFSAAVPLQGGSHHVNEQWPAYWEQKFKAKGYVPVDAIRRRVWEDVRVSFFYAQNILIYVKESEISNYPKLEEEIRAGHGYALSLIHPHMYLYYGERWRMLVPFLGKLSPHILHKVKRLLKKFRA